MKKRDIFIIVVAVLAVLFMSPVFASGKPEEAAEKVEPANLTFWNMQDGTKQEYIKSKVQEFRELHPEVQVIDEYQTHADYATKLPTAIASGTAPDVWSQSYRLVKTYQEQLAPITEEIASAMGYASVKELENSWEKGAIQQYMVDGKIYGFLMESQYFGWAINRQHFIEAGLDPDTDYPKTWDDIITLGKKLVKKDENGRIVQQAVGFPYGFPSIWYYMELQPILLSMGGSVLNKEGTKALINSPEAVKAMKYIKRRFDEGITDRALSTTQQYMVSFQNEETSMAICSLVGWTTMYEKANPAAKGHFKVLLNPVVPGGKSWSGQSSWAHSVNNKSKNITWAWRLVDYITKDPSGALLWDGTLIPRTGWEKTEGAKGMRDVEIVAQAAKSSYPSGSLMHWDLVGPPVLRAMQRILFEDADIQKELDSCKKELDAAIQN